MKAYKDIKTAKELIDQVGVHGISTKEEDICRAQDIFGHSTIEELDYLANEPKTRDYFYFIAFKIWSWEEATRFWNEHTNPEHKKLDELKDQAAILQARLNKAEDELKATKEKFATAQNRIIKDELARAERKSAEKELQEKEMEILKLKARLFDLLDGKAA